MNKDKPDIKALEKKVIELKKTILLMLSRAGSGHTGGSLSIIEIILTLFMCEMNHDPKKPDWPERDRFILSKGHGCPALYAVLAECGYFDKEELWSLRKLGTKLQGHPQRNIACGIEASTGSLGQGLSIACGMALAAKMDKRSNRLYCLMGDGEIQEGQVWEAAMFAAHYKLDNLCAILDWNKIQIDGWVKDTMNIEPLVKKWQAFGWEVFEADGHKIGELVEAFGQARKIKGKPSIILANTIKGKGISFMENDAGWHGIAPKEDEVQKAIEELKGIED